MVGFSNEFTEIKSKLLKVVHFPDDFGVFRFVGMVGSGRTIAAKALFEDLYVRKEQPFECGAWVTIGPKYQLKEILLAILAQIDPGNDKLLIWEEDEKNIGEYLSARLKGRRYLIVLDDIQNTQIRDYLRSSFPEQNNGSLVFVTDSLQEVAQFLDSLHIYELPPLDEEALWDIFRFGMSCLDLIVSPELEEAGKKIVKNCKGLAILLAKVMFFLCKAEQTPEYWNKLAADKDNSIFMIADEISEVCKIKEDAQHDGSILTINLAAGLVDFPLVTKGIKMQLFPERYLPKMEIISFYGMAGIGKTTFVKEIFIDSSIMRRFDHHVWVTLGPKYQSEEILVDILVQIYPDIDKRHMKEDAKLATDLYAQLSNKRCLIVLDDVCDKKALHYLKKLLSDIKGDVLVTTRLANVARFEQFDRIHKMRLLNKEESWCLLHQKVFAKGLCLPELEKAGRKIAENCDGLPLTIVKVAYLLSKAEKTLDYWNKVAEKKNSVFMDAHNEISKALLPSYKSLPPHLKACFLYMGVLPQNYTITSSKLIKLWSAEGFLEPYPSQTIEDFAAECLLDLADCSLIMVCQMGSNFEIKTCRLHSVFWHLSNSEAVKDKFFHAMNSLADCSIESIKSQRRLCIRNSILLGINYVHNSVASNLTTRSLLCTGPPHQYPVPIYFDWRLLRVLDALTIRLYEFPIEVLKLIHLRYLALTSNGKLPTSISKLWNLQFLIVIRHLSIKSSRESLYLPMEIWDMKELKHLQVTGSNLPNPKGGAVLPNLLTLLDVSSHSCTKKVLKRIPNLKRLGIQIDLAPDDNGDHFRSLNRISRLCRLESLKCVVVNPELWSEILLAPYAPISMFPSGIKKLSLSGIGYSWDYMSVIGELKNLEVLKLRCYAFQGRVWETDCFGFMEVKFLLIEDTDLVRWRFLVSFPKLRGLSIRHCYKLVELPLSLPFSIEMIEVVDCNPLAITWAKKMEEEHVKSAFNFDTLKLDVHSSWDADSVKQ